MTRTSTDGDTNGTRGRSGPVLYELIDKEGKFFGIFPSALAAAMIAKVEWPDQQQDPERTGAGWDVQVARCGTCHGRGEVGGFVNAESGYQTDPCPDCSSVREG